MHSGYIPAGPKLTGYHKPAKLFKKCTTFQHAKVTKITDYLIFFTFGVTFLKVEQVYGISLRTKGF